MNDESFIDIMKNKSSKICGICGDKALGYNFNAITCEACKAFFRRNALRTKDFKCPFDENCKIDLITRRFCQKCRLKKCFDIGMKKEWILSEEEKKVKRDKILENRRKKESFNNDNNNEPLTIPFDQTPNDNITSPERNHFLISSPSVTSNDCTNIDLFNSNTSDLYQNSSSNYVNNFNNPLYLFETKHSQNNDQTFLYDKNKYYPVKSEISSSSSSPKSPQSLYSCTAQNHYCSSTPVNNGISCCADKFNAQLHYNLPKLSFINKNNLPQTDKKLPINFANYQSSICSLPISQSINNNNYSVNNQMYPNEMSLGINENASNVQSFSGQSQSNISNIETQYFKTEPIEESIVLETSIMKNANIHHRYNNHQNQYLNNLPKIPPLQLPSAENNVELKPTLSLEFNDNKNNDKLNNENSSLTVLTNFQKHFKDEDYGEFSLDSQCSSDKQDLHLNDEINKKSSKFSIIKADVILAVPDVCSKYLNYVEYFRIEEVQFACKHLHWSHNGSLLKEIKHSSEIYQVAERIVHSLITMAMMINSFSDLCENDQMSLLKYTINEMMIFRSVQCYFSNRDAWIFHMEGNDNLLHYSTCKNQIPDAEFNDDIKQFIMAVPDICKNDSTIFDLATMVILFNPNSLDLRHRDIIKLEYITYLHLLRKYINLNYSKATTNQFKIIFNLINKLRKIDRKVNSKLQFFIVEMYRTSLSKIVTNFHH